MTAAKKKNSRRKQARFRSSRRKRIRNTVLLLLLLVVLGGTGIGAIYVLRNGTVFDKLEDAYVASREFSGGITDLDSLRADGFAKNLCVVVSVFRWMVFPLGKTRKDFFWIWMTEGALFQAGTSKGISSKYHQDHDSYAGTEIWKYG